ncbi:hypothetical protein T11_11733 [Trichinella zimbabwensis]|uniref:Uncharacterized protein n=1 Tax=Trichinella zimbabwensis TaxID=268475 RepID=A0A0V1GEI1_9BILA|nr:hypothetical protein T11_11733 [Trichinella zimbabwensis]
MSSGQCHRTVTDQLCSVQEADEGDQLLAAHQVDPEVQHLQKWFTGWNGQVESPPECS